MDQLTPEVFFVFFLIFPVTWVTFINAHTCTHWQRVRGESTANSTAVRQGGDCVRVATKGGPCGPCVNGEEQQGV